MKVKLCVRVAVLTGMLLLLVSTFKTQPTAACSPAWYEGCLSGCQTSYNNCMNSWIPLFCSEGRDYCENNCDKKLRACYND
jgi:hypothetical protein